MGLEDGLNPNKKYEPKYVPCTIEDSPLYGKTLKEISEAPPYDRMMHRLYAQGAISKMDLKSSSRLNRTIIKIVEKIAEEEDRRPRVVPPDFLIKEQR